MLKIIQGLVFSLATALIISCAHKPQIRGRDIHPQLAELVANFETIYGVQINYPIEIADLSGYGNSGYDGICRETKYHYGNETLTQKLIQIDATLVKNYLEDYPLFVEEVLFHELAHCSFEEQHDNTIIETGIMSGCPLSLMYDTSFYGCYLNHKDYYIEELRNRIKL